MHENAIATEVLNSCLMLHRSFGPGLLENAYQRALVFDLKRKGLSVEEEVPVPMIWQGQRIPIVYRADCVVEAKLVVELKSVERISGVHKKQLLTYLRLSKIKLGLLINFGGEYLKGGVERIANGLGQEPLSFEEWLRGEVPTIGGGGPWAWPSSSLGC